MERTKENATRDYIDAIRKSWTYARMTEDEQKRCEAMIYSNVTQNAVKGAYLQRWDALQAVYSAFLDGIGYDGPFWREPKPALENLLF